MAVLSIQQSASNEALQFLRDSTALSKAVKTKMTQPVKDNPLKVDYKSILLNEHSRLNTTNFSSQPIASTYGADGKMQGYTGLKVNKVV